MRNQLSGNIVLITGGSGGIGLTTAKAFSEQGARVVITDILEPHHIEHDLLF